MTAARRGLPLAAVLVSIVLWSSAFVLSDAVLQSSSPAVLSVARFLLALAVLAPIAARRPGFLRALRAPRTILLGLTGVTMYYALTNLALLFTSAGTVALANAALPIFTALLAVLVLRERPSLRVVIGLALATAGVALVAASGLRLDLGMLLALGGLASYAVYTVLLRRSAGRPDSPDALELATATAIWGTVIMLPWLLGETLAGVARLPQGVEAIGALLFLALIVTAPTLVLFNYGAERLPAAISGIATAGIPALGYAFAVVLGETPEPVKVIGGAIALTGIVVATMAPRPPGPAAPDLP